MQFDMTWSAIMDNGKFALTYCGLLDLSCVSLMTSRDAFTDYDCHDVQLRHF